MLLEAIADAKLIMSVRSEPVRIKQACKARGREARSKYSSGNLTLKHGPAEPGPSSCLLQSLAMLTTLINLPIAPSKPRDAEWVSVAG